MKYLKILFTPALLITVLNISVSAQSDTTIVESSASTEQVVEKHNKSEGSTTNRFYYGGNVGLSFGSYTMIGIYPLLGFKVTPKFSIGTQLSYQFVRDKRYSETRDLSNYGASLFARYRILPLLYAHAEYAAMNYEYYNAIGETKRHVVPFTLLGAGYSKNIGGNTWVNIQVLWDLLQDPDSPYEAWEPFVSFGIGVGF